MGARRTFLLVEGGEHCRLLRIKTPAKHRTCITGTTPINVCVFCARGWTAVVELNGFPITFTLHGRPDYALTRASS